MAVDGKKIGVDKAPQNPPARSGVVGAMMVAVLLGVVIGAAVAALVLPDLMAAAALGGGMIAGAIRVFIFMSSDRIGLTPVENEDGSYQ